MNTIAIIPARYASSRLEGKPLVDIMGKTMIQRVYDQAKKALSNVYVATDDERIFNAVKSFNGNVVMTAVDHSNGTTRCLEAYEKISKDTGQEFDVIINVQGDEPLLVPDQLKELVKPFEKEKVEFSTLVSPVKFVQDLFNESEVFVVFDKDKKALYFSRSVIPHIRGVHKTKWLDYNTFYKHVGLYAYSYKTLKEFANMPTSNLESVEALEQNRWIENGHNIFVEFTDYDTIPVDTIDDLKKVRIILKNELK